MEYGQLAQNIIFSLKYNGRTDIAVTIAEVMRDRYESVREEFHIDMVVPVPIHSKRMGTRGFNQAGYIAREFARIEGYPYVDDLLIRNAQTTAMKGLTPAERRVNIRGAFDMNSDCIIPWAPDEDCSGYIVGKNVMIVDDIYTTGATVDEIADVLKSAGVERVYVFTFAAGADVIKGD